jgi:hypothetical protein
MTESRALMANLFRTSGRSIRIALEILVLTGLIVGTRCANYADVFVGGKVYFVDADCYSRMSRVQIVVQHPGTVVRHEDFENYPKGVKPHTTAPLDYVIVALAAILRPLTAQPVDVAGAIVSPLLALAGGWFLYWWSLKFPWLGRVLSLLIYSLSAILTHGTALGRPDQQSLLIVVLLVVLAAEWKLQQKATRGWSAVSGIGWGLALWVSLYEPLVLLAALVFFLAIADRSRLTARPRRLGWCIFFGIVLLAAMVERRWPEWPGAEPDFARWAATIGELEHVPLTSRLWLDWAGGLILLAPLLLVIALRRRVIPLRIAGLLAFSFCLTISEARWGYFFVLIFVLTIPAQIAVVRPKWIRTVIVVLALLPFLRFWDERLWPNEEEVARRLASRVEAVEWRAAATSLSQSPLAPVMAPWWLAPETAYWSCQPVVAGSSQESLPGIVETARFYLSTSAAEEREILQKNQVRWVLAADGERVALNSAAVIGEQAKARALCRILDASPSQAPPFLELVAQNGACKVYQVRELR